MKKKKIEIIEEGRMSNEELNLLYGGADQCSPIAPYNACTPATNYTSGPCVGSNYTTCQPHDWHCVNLYDYGCSEVVFGCRDFGIGSGPI